MMFNHAARATCRFLLFAALAAACWSCGNGSPTGPSSAAPLPFVSESAAMRYFHEPGDTIDVARQDAFNAWALQRLGVTLPQKVEYRKYRSREAMGRYTGNGNTNGFAEPERFVFHTIWPYDNHESVHVYSALVGRPSDFFNEGIAVAFQTDPSTGNFTVVFNGQQVHEACRGYRRAGTLPLPVSRYVTTSEFRALPDQVLSYRFAGSFVLFLQERFGLPQVLSFFRASGRNDSLAVIRTRFEQAFGATLEAAEAEWLAMLQ
jgi:hypothetical protein